MSGQQHTNVPATLLHLGGTETAGEAPVPAPVTDLPPAKGPALAVPSSLLPGFSTNLFVQAHTSEADMAADLMNHTQVGTVFTVEHRGYRNHLHEGLRAVHTTRMSGPGIDNVLVDRNRYSGQDRATAADGLDPRWIRDQHDVMGLTWALTDSGFNNTLRDIKRTLNDAASMGPKVVVNLPMAFELIRDEADDIVEAINNQNNPVALMLQHDLDPFDEPGVVPGVVHTIRETEHPTLMLRCDTSALGAIAHGAAVGGVGAHSAYRHIFPLKEVRGGQPEKVSFVIPELLGYYLQNRFGPAYLQDPDLEAWRCECFPCAGRSLPWIGNDHKPLHAAARHSVAALARLGARFQEHAEVTDTVRAWNHMCGLAQAAHDSVSNPSGSEWAPKVALKHWRDQEPVRALS